MTCSSDKAGGSVTPNLNVNAVSRRLGPVSGDITALSAGTFDPAVVFADVDARMLGGIKLQDILQQVRISATPATATTRVTTRTPRRCR